MKRFWYLLIVCVCLLSATYGLQAAYITFHDEVINNTGTGFGNVLETLVIKQGVPHGTTEWGSVLWNGSIDVLTNAESQSNTVTVQDLLDEGFDAANLLINLNLNQQGGAPELDVHSFAVRFYTNTAPGSLASFDAVYDEGDARNTASTIDLVPVGQGQGTGTAGYVFRITFEGTEGTDFFANPLNRIGVLVYENDPLDSTANAGAETFYMADADVNTVVPEPATLGFLLLSGLALLRYRRKLPLA